MTVYGVPEICVLDTDARLIQVLGYGANAYLYGVGRIAQQGVANSEYVLGDALGSVHQLVVSLPGTRTLPRLHNARLVHRRPGQIQRTHNYLFIE